MFHIWRTASSRSFDWCAARRRRLQAAGASGAGRRAGRLLRAARPSGRACDILHHSMLALEPSMALASFSLVAYSCRCMRQLRWWRAAPMLASSGDPPPPPCVRWMAGRDAGGVDQLRSTVWRVAPDHLYPTGRRQRGLLLVEVHLRFANVYSVLAPSYVSAAPVRGRKAVYPRGCTARPVSRLSTAVSSADRVESLGF